MLVHFRTLWVSIVLLSSLFLGQTVSADSCFGGSVLGSFVGSTFGTALGNIATRPSCPRREVVVEHVVETPVREVVVMPARAKRLEVKYREELADLTQRKHALERRIQALEDELAGVDEDIDTCRQTLKNLENKHRPCKSSNETEIAEIRVK